MFKIKSYDLYAGRVCFIDHMAELHRSIVESILALSDCFIKVCEKLRIVSVVESAEGSLDIPEVWCDEFLIRYSRW